MGGTQISLPGVTAGWNTLNNTRGSHIKSRNILKGFSHSLGNPKGLSTALPLDFPGFINFSGEGDFFRPRLKEAERLALPGQNFSSKGLLGIGINSRNMVKFGRKKDCF